MNDEQSNEKANRLWRCCELFFRIYRSEIQERIKLQTQLLSIKMITLGVLFGVFFRGDFDTTELLKYFVWILPLISMSFDFAIFQNVIILNTMGLYLHKEISKKWLAEEYLGRQDLLLWEDFFSKHYSSAWDFLRRLTAIGVSIVVIVLCSIWLTANTSGTFRTLALVTYLIFFGADIAIFIRSLLGQSHSRIQ